MGKSNIVISGYYGFNNAGDEAMLYSILSTLRKNFGESDITVISGNPDVTCNIFKVNAIPRFNILSIIKSIGQSDLLISGGGSLLQDVTSWKSLIYYLSIICVGICFGKHVFLYSQGIGPVRHRWVRWILKAVLNHVDAITVRDNESKGFLERLGVKNDIYCTADAVLSLSPVSLTKGKEILSENNIPLDKKIIGISIRRWMDTDYWSKQLRSYMEAMNKNEEYNFVFIPMQFPEDYKTTQEYCAGIPHSFILKKSYSTEDLMSLIGCFDLLVGIRLHALIFAALMHVPFLGISYDPKIDNFLQAIREQAVFSLGKFDKSKLYDESIRLLSIPKENHDWYFIDMLRDKAQETAEILKRTIHNK